MRIDLSAILLIAAVVCFVLSAFGVSAGDVNLVSLGLALGFGAFLVRDMGAGRRI